MISKFELSPEEGIVVNNAVTRHAVRQAELQKEFVMAVQTNDSERNSAILPILQLRGKMSIPATLALQPRSGVYPCQLAWEEEKTPGNGNGNGGAEKAEEKAEKKPKNRIKEAKEAVTDGLAP